MIALKDVVGGSAQVAEQESEQSLFIPKYKQTKGADDDPRSPASQTPEHRAAEADEGADEGQGHALRRPAAGRAR